jgi:Protein of unknown function (DUF6044)
MEFQSKRESYLFLLAIAAIVLFISPLFILGENAHIRVHDNLDSNIAWYKVLKESGETFGNLDAKIPQVIGGQLSRNAYGSEWTGIVLLHYFLPSMTAYSWSQFITRFFAFIGMYLLLKTHIIKDRKAYPITIGVSLAFALTPFWPSGMLSTLGHPLALWAFLNIRAKNYSWKNWLTIGLLPFYSSIVLGFFFFIVAIGLLWLYDLIVKKDWNLPFLGSIFFMCSIFMLVEYRLVYSMLFSHEPVHRLEFISSRHDFARSLRLSFKNFVLGHNHVLTIHTFVILPILTLVLLISLTKKKKQKEDQLFIFLFILNYILSLWYALWFNNLWIPLKERIDLLNTFNFARFHFLRPLIIYTSFGLGLFILWKKYVKWRKVVIGIIIAQILVLVPFNEEILFGIIMKEPSFKQFYATEQFEEIKNFIGLPQNQYKVASIGLHPAIAQYNGFYTLDTYNNFYPLSYKYEFRKIIENELEKSNKLKTYYDEWGSRCYIFVAELGKKYDFRKNSKKVIKNLNLNTEAFKNMGGKYIFSSVPIQNAEQNQLTLLKTFDHPDSVWRIYLYEAL